MTELYTLYGVDAKSNSREWTVSYDGDTVTTTHGLVNGKKTTSVRSYVGKNSGKKNETTDEEQAQLEAERAWIKQLDKGYLPHEDDKEGTKIAKKVLKAKALQNNSGVGLHSILRGEEVQGNLSVRKTKGNDTLNYDVINGMLCQKWEEKDKVLKYFNLEEGIYIQPKLDGVRALAKLVIENGVEKVKFFSRGKKEYPHLDHIREDVKKLLKLNPEYILDGEFYAHEIKGELVQVGKTKKYEYKKSNKKLGDSERFDVITACARAARSQPHPLESQIQYHIFDLFEPDKIGKKTDMQQKERFDILISLFDDHLSKTIPSLRLVDTIESKKVSDVYKYHSRFIEQGYEGTIIRASDNFYIPGKRSNYIRKYKNFVDAEYEIIGVEINEGVDDEYFVWLLQTDDGVEFKAKPMGTRDQRRKWYAESDDHIGKMAIIEYQKLSKDGVPIFGKMKNFREEEQ